MRTFYLVRVFLLGFAAVLGSGYGIARYYARQRVRAEEQAVREITPAPTTTPAEIPAPDIEPISSH